MVKLRERVYIYVSDEKHMCNPNGYRAGMFLVLHGRAHMHLLFEGTNLEQCYLLENSLSFFDC